MIKTCHNDTKQIVYEIMRYKCTLSRENGKGVVFKCRVQFGGGI